MQGIVNVNKPTGWTSFDVVNKLKRVYNTRRIGHLGTLDPMAEGVLPVAIGKATKLFDYYLKKTKLYRAEFCFGLETDTLDADGEVVNKTNFIPSEEQINEELKNFIGTIKQVPPQYSAVKVNGKRAYDLARNNVDFSLTAKEVSIYKFKLENSPNENTFAFLIECSAGTYIRSLARDLAHNLGSLATMTKLTRLRSGEFKIEDSKTIDQIIEKPQECLATLDEVFKNLPMVELDGEIARKIKNGVSVKIKNKNTEGLSRIYLEGEFFAIGEIKNDSLGILVRLYEGE